MPPRRHHDFGKILNPSVAFSDSIPPPASNTPSGLVEHFFRHETGRLHGALVRLLGVNHLSLAEDIAQDALLRALRAWSMGGIPPNPSAWITRVAMNLAKDHLRHRNMSASKETAIITHIEQTIPSPALAIEASHTIRDDSLRLLFVCCHPAIAPDAQVILALKVLCGFSTGEIARAFFASEAAIEKQLTRTKNRIQESNIAFELPEAANLAPRLDGVLAALYLLFNEGYKASSGDRLLREDLCRESIRLVSLLLTHPAGNATGTHALLALMLLTSARFPARLDDQGALLRLDEQNRCKWDARLINEGLVHLAAAADGDSVSEYHLQAGIAALHCVAPDAASTDWTRILSHYDVLLRLKPSPVVELNRAVAVAHVHGPQAGLDALNAITQSGMLDSLHLFHAVAGELHTRLNNHRAAAESYRRALALARVGPEQSHLARQLERAENFIC